ncbi:putative peroxidase [Helianthus annuus]|uniref:Peroxidase n=1 Tax=Helianthus annuus TaxID=4232 RepID=A0A251VLP4_HELAN|nr:peroxidase 19 [Helianthus annuus]KAF5821235.1 putative peroxidase [Helianthus annuus]KAJ0610934.1 putative peroxidase [Helianthus annuus]KAJ0621794.1 putative peroxidase [Helianthus annuus]KAJ0947136.1 putative peroxidase [Helianthus annuus]
MSLSSSILILLFSTTITTCLSSETVNTSMVHHRFLTVDYYAKTCPQLEQIVAFVTSQNFKVSPATAPATIRLFFHDCFVQGCDGSILISMKPGSMGLPEKESEDNQDIPAYAYQIIEKAKAMVEMKCPGVVSCADILALAARDYIHLAGGPYYAVKKGRWDGKQKPMASLVYPNIPHANSTIDNLIKLFSSKGLTLNDLVVLSGAHSIGYAHCKHFVNRLYNFKGTNKPDPDMDPRQLKSLRMTCPQHGGNVGVVIPFDATTPFSFDNAYFQNLQAKLGLLATDKELFLDPRTRPLVQAFANDKNKFFQDFSSAMERLGNVGVKRGKKHGEIRRVCNMHL